MLPRPISYCTYLVRYTSLLAKVSLSPGFAYKVAKNYWANCDKPHADTSEKAFREHYGNLVSILKPTRNDLILDAGCGTGEITHLFDEGGFRVRGFDSSEHFVSRGRSRFGDGLFYVDDLVFMRHKELCYTKVFLMTVFYYVHPAYRHIVLKNLYDITEDGGAVFLIDNPDHSKRSRVEENPLMLVLTEFFPLYDVYNAGFWIKTRELERTARKIGFGLEKLDSWAPYRSHYVLRKT